MKESTDRSRVPCCLLCGAQQLRIDVIPSEKDHRWDVVHCTLCGLRQLVVLADRAGIPDFWGPTTKTPEDYTRDEVVHEQIERFKALVGPRLKSLRRQLGRKPHLLDVGCGSGTFMQAARELGCEVYGLDISPHACRIARERLGLESERVRVGELLDDIWQEARFDVVSLWDVLEHFDKPVEQIKGARRLLVDHGILLLETPDDSFFLRRLLRWITNHTGGRVRTDRYFYYEVHLAYFNPVTIRTLLGKTGFRIRSYYRAGTVRKKQIASMRHWYRPGLRWALMMLRSDFLCAVFLRNKMIITAVVNNAVLMSNK